MKKVLLLSTLFAVFLAVLMTGCGSSGIPPTSGILTMTPQEYQQARHAAKIAHVSNRQTPITNDSGSRDIYVWPSWLEPSGYWMPGHVRRITGNPGAYSSVHVSLNTTSIVFSSIVNGYNQIFTSTVPAEGQTLGSPIQLTADVEHHWLPHISADGSKVVFTKFDSSSNGDVVCIINNIVAANESCLDFSATTPILKGVNIWHASWTADDKIAFEAWGGPLTSDEIFMVNANGSGLIQITNNLGTNNYDECPSVSTDGKWMAIDTWKDAAQQYEIAQIDLNTKQRMDTESDAWDPLRTPYTTVYVSQQSTDQSLEIYFMAYGPLRLTNNTYADYFAE